MTAAERLIIKQVKADVFSFHQRDFTGHDVAHLERVLRLANHLSRSYPIDPFTLQLIVLLHDIEDPKLAGTMKVVDILNRYAVKPDVKEKVLRSVDALSYSSQKKGKVEVDLEGKIAQDADRLDAIGAIGIARVFSYGAHLKRPLEETLKHFDEKLFKLEGLMNTPEAKQLAQERTQYLRQYYELFLSEMRLKK